MSERLDTLIKARERMLEDRDAKAERARSKFCETQTLVDALDRAISGEQAFAAKD
jgi:hypothetical protein